MKYMLLLITVLLILSCKTQIVPLYKFKYNQDIPKGTYYKDLDYDLNKFVGTWLIQNDSISFKIVLQKRKKQRFLFPDKYHDIIIGEYQYVENGIEIFNTLPKLNNTKKGPYWFNILGGIIISNNYKPLKCPDCTENERRILINFYNFGERRKPMTMILRHVMDNGVETLQAMIKGAGSYFDSDMYPNSPRVYFGEYFTLVKQ